MNHRQLSITITLTIATGISCAILQKTFPISLWFMISTVLLTSLVLKAGSQEKERIVPIILLIIVNAAVLTAGRIGDSHDKLPILFFGSVVGYSLAAMIFLASNKPARINPATALKIIVPPSIISCHPLLILLPVISIFSLILLISKKIVKKIVGK